MSKVEEYSSLAVRQGDPLYEELMQLAAAEAEAASIPLTRQGDDGAMSGGLTPAMSSWVNTKVGPIRQAALNQVESLTSSIQVGRSGYGKSHEIEGDRIKRASIKRRIELHDRFSKENFTRIQEMDRLEDEYDRLRISLGGREAKHPPKWVDFAIPIAILIPESLLNFESFLASPLIQTGVMALGVTLIVGIAIGFSAFLFGRFLKAYQFWMRPDDQHQKNRGLRMVAIAMFLLIGALGVVAAARYYYLVPMIEEALILGLTPPNVIWSTTSLLMGNIVVFLLGVAVTYWLHDENPEYAEIYTKFKETGSEFRKLEKAHLLKPLEDVDRRYRQDSDALIKFSSQMDGNEEYGSVKEKLASISAKDAEIVGVLQSYRNLLSKVVSEKNRNRRGLFVTDSEFSGRNQRTVEMDADQFLAQPIYLYKAG